jgi:hypothetical protein
MRRASRMTSITINVPTSQFGSALQSRPVSVGERGFEVGRHPERSEDGRTLGIAIEALDPAVFDFEYVAARGARLFAAGLGVSTSADIAAEPATAPPVLVAMTGQTPG